MDHVRTMEDKDIDKCIIQIAEGDITSLKRLYDEFRIPVYKFALSILKSHEAAEDVSQRPSYRDAQGFRVITGKHTTHSFSSSGVCSRCAGIKK